MESNYRHVCPQCGYEYESWVQVCPDCKRPIEDRHKNKPEEPSKGELSDQDPQWTVVTNVPNAIIGNLIKSQLQDAGIPALMLRSSSVDIAEFSHNDFVPQDIRVPRACWQEARSLVDSPASDSLPFGGWQEPGESLEPWGDEAETEQRSDLSEGWQVLPASSASYAGESYTDWHWADKAPTALPTGYSTQEQEQELDDDQDAGQDSPPWREQNYRGSYSVPGSLSGHGQPTWIRLVYAVLLLVMSLPFIISVLQQLWRIWQPQP